MKISRFAQGIVFDKVKIAAVFGVIVYAGRCIHAKVYQAIPVTAVLWEAQDEVRK